MLYVKKCADGGAGDPSHDGAGAVGRRLGLARIDEGWLGGGYHGHDGGLERTYRLMPDVCHGGPKAGIQILESSGNIS
jgi:hypothetical protein